MPKTYSIHDYNDIGVCYVDGGKTREAVIEETEEWLSQKMFDDGEYGSNHDYFTLVTIDDITGEETQETVTLHWGASRDNYDGGRAVYNASRI